MKNLVSPHYYTKNFTLPLLVLLLCVTNSIAQNNGDMSDVPLIENYEIAELSQPPVSSVSYTGTLTSDDNIKGSRLNRNLVASTCAIPKVCDIFASSGYLYDVHVFINPEPNPLCVDLTLDATCTEGNLTLDAYLGFFNPNDICENYLGDPGLSTGTPASPVMYSVEIPVGEALILVVGEPNGGTTCEIGGGYEVTVSGEFTERPIPTIGEWGIIILSISFLILGIVAVKIKQFSFS